MPLIKLTGMDLNLVWKVHLRMLIKRSVYTNICKACARPVVCISIPRYSTVILELGNKNDNLGASRSQGKVQCQWNWALFRDSLLSEHLDISSYLTLNNIPELIKPKLLLLTRFTPKLYL